MNALADNELKLESIFSYRYRNYLRYTAAWGHWSIWNGQYWVKDETLYVFHLARTICDEAVANMGYSPGRLRIAKAQTVDAVERLTRADRRYAATVDQWDKDPWLLTTPGGVIDLRTGMRRPARREDYMTKTTACAPGGDCPQWRSFLSRITDGDKGLQRYLQKMAGYALTGVTKEQALFFLYGTGANGKSVFLKTIAGVMEDYAMTTPIETFIASFNEHHPTEIAGLRGARLVTAVEPEEGRQWAESKIKMLTGGDPVPARLMRQDFFTFTPQFKLIIAGNHKPGLRSVDEALRRRFRLLPFTVTVPVSERDAELADKLCDERGGILQWMIEGCLLWQKEGLLVPDTVRVATDGYLDGEDLFSQWIEDGCEKEGSQWTSVTDLFGNWILWCETNREYVGTKKRFSENLQNHGFERDRKRVEEKLVRGFKGIGLKG
jgi:putative DNA primase/helicase